MPVTPKANLPTIPCAPRPCYGNSHNGTWNGLIYHSIENAQNAVKSTNLGAYPENYEVITLGVWWETADARARTCEAIDHEIRAWNVEISLSDDAPYFREATPGETEARALRRARAITNRDRLRRVLLNYHRGIWPEWPELV